MADFYNDDIKNETSCTEAQSDCLSIPKRHASLLIAGFLALLFFTFITGYFWGKRTAVEQLTSKIEEELLADQINSSFYHMQDKATTPRPVVEQEMPVVLEPSDSDDGSSDRHVEENQIEQQSVQELAEDIESELESRYYAQLIGFGTHGAANRFAQRVQKNIPVEVRRRVSQSAKGKKRVWYQVVTHPFESKQELVAVVEKVSKKERLNGVQIVTC